MAQPIIAGRSSGYIYLTLTYIYPTPVGPAADGEKWGWDFSSLPRQLHQKKARVQ